MPRRRKLSIKAREWVDERIQARILTMLPDSHPGARTLPELTREIGDRDAVIAPSARGPTTGCWSSREGRRRR